MPYSCRSLRAVSSKTTSARPTVILATLAAIAIALAVCATAATVIVASDVTREREKRRIPGMAVSSSPAEARAALAELVTMRALVDSLIEPLAPFAPADSLTLALMARLWTKTAEPSVLLPVAAHAIPDAPRVEMSRMAAFVHGLRADSAFEAAHLAEFAADTLSPWLRIWRTHARSEALSPFWGYRHGLPGVTTRFDLAKRSASTARHLQLLNELAGRLAFRAGRYRVALERGRENLAASRHYLDSPSLLEFSVGRSIALAGARLVADAAAALGDSATVALTREFEGRAMPGLSEFAVLQRAAERDAADPSTPMAMELFDDEKLPFAVRAEILYAVIAGACNHTREVLFGFAPEREQRLTALAERWRDHPTLGPALALLPPTARRVREQPASLLGPDVWPTQGLFDFLLPESVAARAVVCQQAF